MPVQEAPPAEMIVIGTAIDVNDDDKGEEDDEKA
jgi:hypothetical protein